MATGTSFFDQLFATQVYVFDANGNPMNIGYYTGSNVPCNGNLFIYDEYMPSYAAGLFPIELWMVKDVWGVVNTSVAQKCAASGIAPQSPLSAVAVSQAVAAVPQGLTAAGSAATDLGNEVAGGVGSIASGITKGLNAVGGIGPNLLLIGGGALAIMLLARRSR